MSLVIPRLELRPGNIVCLHIPHGSYNEANVLEEELFQLAIREGKTAAFCRPAKGRRGILEWLRRQRTQEWLGRAADISLEQSGRMIADFGVHVADVLLANAGTVRCLLGIAATLVRKPAVLEYSTVGLDPRGRMAVHQYAASKGSELCLVHLSYPTIFGDGTPAPRVCPANAQCVTLTEASGRENG
ncbi:MAG: hypothetical protein L0Y72_05205 [Gemmataceae bacterium]|nr:hypothetical protein [Gemmataceae bacterium]MCI0738420.1 hypothetical protein [Gemmataceae bacterium]